MSYDDALRDEAAAWAVRTGDPAFDGWDDFADWLERDPAHARAYDEVVAAVADAADVLPPPIAAENDDQPAELSRRRWVGGALSLALVGVVALGAWQWRDGSYTLETAPGETRVIALAGGGEIALAGGSRITLDRNEPREASLEQGQALFTIEHDPSAPFTLAVGEDRLVDIGTVFDVNRTGTGFRVAVSEGAVVLNPDSENARISPGEVLSKDVATGRHTLGTIALDQVGEWREGRLTFQDAPLDEVAAELSRATGTVFVASPRSGGQRISGSIDLESVRRDPRALGILLGFAVARDGEAWEIGER